MSREISLFADYHRQENSLTNYCGLVLKLLYEENPKSFEEVLVSLLSDDINLTVGPSFTQQTKSEKSIPDLAIHQRSFSIYFETKLDDWFYTEQLERHISALKDKSVVSMLFALSNFETDDLQKRFKIEIDKARKSGVIFEAITFEDFVGALESVQSSDRFKNTLADFVLYLDRNERLPKWKHLLDVVNSGQTLDEIKRGVYMCPDTGGAYSHRRAKYFGPYADKKVSVIFEIDAVVTIERNLGDGRVNWKNVDAADVELIAVAKSKLEESEAWRIEENEKLPLQVFLLSHPVETDFQKDTSGGMYQSKKYFWDIAKGCNDSKDLANRLKGKKWSEFQ
jgi:hypothetical protein